ncbi:MAG: DUF1788 domain-containing protein [Bacillota bacterium]|jgi:hypothetical protein|nr:DUF1788 domain-containing protein [Bacillota bacterium]HOL52133.1 DUF1788 domain-containing protein [Bacillota bacterium]HQD81286.1 DUF1788 domain-containing protein [Bacillota bacterium]
MSARTPERLDELALKLKDESFLSRKGLGNEVSVWIFDYDPADELLVRQFIRQQVERSQLPGSVGRIAGFDLYELAMEIAERKGVLDRLESMEETRGPEYLLEAMRSILQASEFVSLMNERITDESLVFITGVGRVWPLVRSHTILNNLGGRLDSLPVVLFFPGSYDGLSLQLFNILDDDNYYRAFQAVPTR